MKEFISIKLCPICGEAPERVTTDLGRPGGHGYPGCQQFRYQCECCKVFEGVSYDTVSCSKEEAINRAKQSWNKEVDRIQEYLNRIYIKRTDIT